MQKASKERRRTDRENCKDEVIHEPIKSIKQFQLVQPGDVRKKLGNFGWFWPIKAGNLDLTPLF